MAMTEPTRAADGWPRRAFTVAEIERMVDTGVIGESERLELIGGELLPMAPKGILHELIKTMLVEHWIKLKPDTLMLTPETTFRLSEITYVEPDIVIYRRADGLARLSASTALLVVEIADKSISYDLQKKPEVYAAFGIAELWVIDGNTRIIHVHRDPVTPMNAPSGYRNISRFSQDQVVTPLLAPELELQLSELDLGSGEDNIRSL